MREVCGGGRGRMEYSQEAWESSEARHVLFVSSRCCTRVHKQAAALRARGWRVDSLSRAMPDDGYFDCVRTDQPRRFAQAIRESGASLIHVHNEPDELMRFADSGSLGRPVVYDCHDLEYNRTGYVTDDELFAFWRADGIVSVSEAHRDFAYSLHRWHQPSAVVRSLPLRSTIPALGSHKRRGVVYQGGLMRPGMCPWRDLSVPCEVFDRKHIRFDLYTSSDMHDPYPNVRGNLPYDELLKALTRYSFGFVGHDPKHPVYEYALPNKLWEYAACGVIPLLINAPEAARVFGSGIAASSTEEAVRLMRSCDKDALRGDVLAHARFMDDEIDTTIALYEELLCTKSSTARISAGSCESIPQHP